MLFEKIGQGKAVSAAADKEMLEVLKRQKFNDGIPAGCRPARLSRTRPAPSPASTTTPAIVLGPKPYVLVILVRGIQDQKVSGPLMAAISKAVWAVSFQLPAPSSQVPHRPQLATGS